MTDALVRTAEPTAALEFEVTLTADDYTEYSLALMRARPFRPLIVLGIWLPIYFGVLALASWLPRRPRPSLFAHLADLPREIAGDALLAAVCVVPPALYAAYLLAWPLWRRTATRHTYRKLFAGRVAPAASIRIDGDGLRFSRPGYEGRLSWSLCEAWIEQADRHILRFGLLDAVILPLRGLDAGQRAALRRRIETHVARQP